jgi:hypothetical protein
MGDGCVPPKRVRFENLQDDNADFRINVDMLEFFLRNVSLNIEWKLALWRCRKSSEARALRLTVERLLLGHAGGALSPLFFGTSHFILGSAYHGRNRAPGTVRR